ncbi:MAG: ABC transporter substrate-binding protein [Cyanobacteria bacterium J06634_6]
MKRRWFLAGLALPVVVAGCQSVLGRSNTQQNSAATVEAEPTKVSRNNKTLVMATTANYPPYQQRLESSTEDTEDAEIVGFDIDLAQLIAERLDRKLTIVDVEFDTLISAVTNEEVDIAMAALAPNRSRKQRVDFSNIYYRSRHALISLDGYLRGDDLNYQTIGVLADSVQARFADNLTNEISSLDIVPYRTLDAVFEALDVGEIEAAFVEANIAESYLPQYPEFAARIMPSDEPSGSAIALAKNSPLRSPINAAIADIKASGEMDRLIAQWFD